MKITTSPVVDLWAKEYSRYLENHKPYQLSEQFLQLASLFSPGASYFYIMNMQNLAMSYVSPDVLKITGIPPEEVRIDRLVGLALEEEVETLVKKELLIKDFFQRFLSPKDVTSYKIVYSYRMKGPKGNIKHMLHQAMAMSLCQEGQIEHVLSIHTDVTHLKLPKNDRVSFIGLNDMTSYYNQEVEGGKFEPECNQKEGKSLASILTCREKEILNFLAQGYSAKAISEILHLSFNTVRTHRKNMLRKAECANTTELVSKGLMEGTIG